MSDVAINPGPAQIVVSGWTPLVAQTVSGQPIDDLTASLTTLFPNQQVPVVDGVRMVSEWYRFFSKALQAQQGRVEATPTADLIVAINFAQHGVAQLQQIVTENRAFNLSAIATINALTSQVQALTAAQGSTPADIPPVPTTIPPYTFDSPGGGGGD